MTALTKINQTLQPLELATLDEVMTLGKVLAQSGLFADIREAGQAVVKILTGRELGIGPMMAMSGIFIVGGKPTLSATLIASVIKKSGKYDYRVIDLTNERAEIGFYQNGQQLTPTSVFTIEDAARANLTNGKNAHSWKHYTRNMLFARALTNGVRWHCPELFGGAPPYTPEEMNLQVGEDGEPVGVAAPVAHKALPAAPTPPAEAPKQVALPAPAPVADPLAGVNELARELHKDFGVSYQEIQLRMEALTGAKKRADLTPDQIATVVADFEEWAARCDAARQAENPAQVDQILGEVWPDAE